MARALGTLPRLAQALARGELSYAKIRALTRVATPETEERLLAVGRAGTAEHVERIVRGWRRVDRNAEAMESAKRHAGRGLRVYQDEDGMMIVRGRLAPEVGALLVQALAAARETLYRQTRATSAGAADVSAVNEDFSLVSVSHFRGAPQTPIADVSAEPIMWLAPLPVPLKLVCSCSEEPKVACVTGATSPTRNLTRGVRGTPSCRHSFTL